MAEVLVLVEHTDGEVKKVTGELLTLAARLGEPSAVFLGSGFDAAKESLAAYGAAKVYVVEASTPAILSVVEKINEPRYPSFKGIMAAKKKPLTTVATGDAGIDPGQVGRASCRERV